MAAPTYYPLWATTDTTLASTSQANKSRPKESLRTIGWDKGQIPSAEELNWMFNNIYLWTLYLSDTVTEIQADYLPLIGGTLTGDLTVNTNLNVLGTTTMATATVGGDISVTGYAYIANSLRAGTYIDIGYQNTTAGTRQITFYSAGNTTGTASIGVTGSSSNAGDLTLTSGTNTFSATQNTFGGIIYVTGALRTQQYLDLGQQNTTAGARQVSFYTAGDSSTVPARISATGTSTSNGILTITSAETVTSGNLSAYGGLTVTGNITASSALSVSGTSYLMGTISLTGNITSTGTNGWTGTNTFSGGVGFTSTTAFTGTASFSNTTSFTNTMTLKTSQASQNGYTYLPNDFILQWGLATIPVTAASQASVAVTFPIAFPNACYSVTANTTVKSWSSSDGYIGVLACVGATTTGFTLWGDSDNSLNATVAQPCYWQAIGK